MYSQEQRLKAVKLYIQYGHHAATVLRELGYPNSAQSLVNWYREFERSGTLHSNYQAALKYTQEQRAVAVQHYIEHGKCLSYTCRELGYPSHTLLIEGCLSQKVLEDALGCRLIVPKKKGARQECSCLLGADIGAYNTCGHGCLYCYANYDRETVRRNMTLHDKKSPFLIGNLQEGDVIKDAKQISWKDRQMSIFDLL